MLYGTYPADDAEEICIPYRCTEAYIGDFSNYEDIIGQTVMYKGKEYRVCGITDGEYRVAYCSFTSKGDNFGLIRYDGFFDDKISSSYGEDLSVCETDRMLIVTEPGKEKEILNHLVSLYPGENYASYSLGKVFERIYNRHFVLWKILPMNLLFSIPAAVFLALIMNGIFVYDRERVRDFQCFYVKKKEIGSYYVKKRMMRFVLMSGFYLIFNLIFNRKYGISSFVLLLDCVVIVLPSAVLLIIRNRQAVLGQDIAYK